MAASVRVTSETTVRFQGPAPGTFKSVSSSYDDHFVPEDSNVPEGGDANELIRRAQLGDVAAFERLVATIIPRIRRFARAFAHCNEDADDLAQEALIKVYRAIGSYRFEAAFSTWVFTLVRNCFRDAAKGQAARLRALDNAVGPGGPDAEEGPPQADALMEQAEERQRLWRAIGEVPAEFRTALVLSDIEGFSYDEIAAVEKVALGTVKSRISRGREQLRRLLGAAQRTVPGNPIGAPVVPHKEPHSP